MGQELDNQHTLPLTHWALLHGEILLWEVGEEFWRVSMGVVPSQHPFPRQGSTWASPMGHSTSIFSAVPVTYYEKKKGSIA